MIRVGTSYDIHQLIEGEFIILGGLRIPAKYKVVAHSDGDVLLHALSEAIFSALGLEDLGSYFPNDLESTRQMDSTLILKRATDELDKQEAKINNIGVHVFLESPKLKEYKHLIKINLSKLLDLSPEYIAVHAGTMEKMGPIGEGKAIAAFATVTISDNK